MLSRIGLIFIWIFEFAQDLVGLAFLYIGSLEINDCPRFKAGDLGRMFSAHHLDVILYVLSCHKASAVHLGGTRSVHRVCVGPGHHLALLHARPRRWILGSAEDGY